MRNSKFKKINDALFNALDLNDASLIKGGLLAETSKMTQCTQSNTQSGCPGQSDTVLDCPDMCPDNGPCPY